MFIFFFLIMLARPYCVAERRSRELAGFSGTPTSPRFPGCWVEVVVSSRTALVRVSRVPVEPASPIGGRRADYPAEGAQMGEPLELHAMAAPVQPSTQAIYNPGFHADSESALKKNDFVPIVAER